MSSVAVPAEFIEQQVRLALAEDIGPGDVTAALLPADKTVHAHVLSRQQAIICGCAWFTEVFRQLDSRIHIDWHVHDGDEVQPDQILCHLHGNARHLLSGERTALNFLQLLSGTATTTHRYASRLAGTHTRVLDTRKTLPGLRLAQKYAVHCGGGMNHRIGLYDMVLIKENHIAAAGSIKAAVTSARQQFPAIPIEVEVENLAELQQALAAGVDRVLLDNMSNEQLQEAVKLTAGRAKLEASGGMSLERIHSVAETGVDYISVGALTKDVQAIDLSMRIEPD